MSSSFDSYQILYKTSSDSTYTNYDTSSVLTPVITSLSPNTGYYIQLIPYSNTSGLYGSAIETYSVTLAKLTNFTFGQVNSYDITLNWTGNYYYVKIYYGITSGTYTNSVNSYDNYKTITGLTPNITYYFNIVPYNIADISSGYYNEISTTPTVPPPILTNFTYKLTNFNFNDVNSTHITLYWTGNYSYVKIYYGTTSGTYTNSVTSYDNNVTITGLITGTPYYLNIAPYNSVDISSGYYNEIITTPTSTPTIIYTITYSGSYTKSGNVYYLNSGSNNTLTVNKYCKIKLLLVGGGGGGGRDAGGGGGGGGVIYLDPSYLYSSTTYHVTIGSGGAGGSSTSGSNGGNTFITELNLTAIGGGGGGGKQTNGLNGGCGGGAGHADSLNTYLGGSGTINQGYSGGSSYSNSGYGGGGGGAGGVGTSVTTDTIVGNGGIGIQNSITGTNTYYGGGGGGGYWKSTLVRSTGGSGGGGSGGYNISNLPIDGSANTGGGGGGGGSTSSGNGGAGGAGGSGVIIVYIDPYFSGLTSLAFGQVNATNITLYWRGNYSYVKIYYGTTSGTYTNSFNSYNNNETITGLTTGILYYFNIEPYNSIDITPGYYKEISKTPTATSTPTYIITYSGSYTKSGNVYYLNSGSNNTLTVNKDCKIKILLVGGGGGGGYASGGGGGGGGVIYLESTYLYADTTYHVTIGSGGAGGTSSMGSNGGNTFITELDLTAIGGGGGGGRQKAGLNGGCGGGAGHADSLNTYLGGSGTTNQGYSGGSSYSISGYGGGGGGAGGAGTSIITDTTVGNGGIGIQNSITGTNTYYGGGGGGGYWQSTLVRSTGGSGGGGSGGYNNTNPTAGIANTGGGGGGGGIRDVTNGASGGSGIIIIAIV